MKKLTTLLALLTLLLFCGTTAFAQGASVVKFPVIVSGVIPCTGEFVFLEGTWQITSNVNADASGGLHVTDNWNIHAKGSGDYGNEYVFSNSDNFSINIAADALPFVGSNTVTQNVVSKGGDANFKVHITDQFTVNNNGEVTASIYNVQVSCQ